MISVSAGDFHAGDNLYRGLSSLGQGLGEALQRYQQMKDQQTQADTLMATLAQTPDPTEYNPDAGVGAGAGPGGPGMGSAAGAPGGPMGMLAAAASGSSSGSGSKPKAPRTILDPKSYERYLAVSGRNHAAAAAGLMGALQMYHTMQKEADAQPLERAQVRQANAHADYYERRADPTKEANAFTPGVSRITKTETGEPLDSPIDVLRVSPNQVRPIPKPGEIQYDEESGLPFTIDRNGQVKVIKPEDIATARAMKPQPSATPAPSRGGSWLPGWLGGPKASATATPAPAAGGKVKVMAPNGRMGLIPAEQLAAALAQGYKQAP